jgi:hypothetical protein
MIKVYVNDALSPGYDFNAGYFSEMDEWAKEHCLSYQGYEVVDTSDTSLIWDEVAEFCFEQEQDVLMFKLKWPCD